MTDFMNALHFKSWFIYSILNISKTIYNCQKINKRYLTPTNLIALLPCSGFLIKSSVCNRGLTSVELDLLGLIYQTKYTQICMEGF